MSSSTNACPFWIEAVVDHLSSDAMNGYLDSSSPSSNDAAAMAIVMVAQSNKGGRNRKATSSESRTRMSNVHVKRDQRSSADIPDSKSLR